VEKILLFSDDEKLFEITKQVTEGKQELIWSNYQWLETNGYPFADVVIMHLDEEKIKKDIFQPIIKVKGRLGHSTPILAVIENGSMQDIFSVLKVGVYDYIETIDNLEKYQKKIQDIILWEWYLKKYKGGVKKQ
jgi:DNA-binding NtrC family response regulator